MHDFFGIERIAVVDGAREVLLRAVDAVRGYELRGPQDADVAKQLRTDFVLPAFAAIVLHVDRPQAHAEAEEREERVGLVVGMRRRLHERARDIQLTDREAERQMPAVGRRDRVGHPVLRAADADE